MGMGRPLRGAVRPEAVSPCPSSWVRGSGTFPVCFALASAELPASVVNLRSINSFHCKIAESARSPSAAPIGLGNPISNTVGRRLTRRRPSRPTAVAQRGWRGPRLGEGEVAGLGVPGGGRGQRAASDAQAEVDGGQVAVDHRPPRRPAAAGGAPPAGHRPVRA